MNHQSYMPLLRWKQSEWLALGGLQAKDADLILPLVEIVPKMVDEGKLPNAWKQINRAWGGRRIVVDGAPPVARTTDQTETVYAMLETEAPSIGAEVVPVIAPGQTPGAMSAARAVAAAFGAGVALRVRPEELGSVDALMLQIGLSHLDVDLIIDFGAVVADDARYLAVQRHLPRAMDWRTVVFLGGSFPKYLTGLIVGEHLLPRREGSARPAGGHRGQ